jgi:hypothetical protein
VHTVLVAGLILTPLCGLWLVIAEGLTGLRHPLDIYRPESDREQPRRAKRGWRLYYRVHTVERTAYRLGLLGGVLCLIAAAVASVAG